MKSNLVSHNLVQIHVCGNSMYPILNDGDILPAFVAANYYPGDIIVFLYKNGYIIHRLLRIINGRYFAKGDNSFRIEDFSFDEIVGKAILPNDLNNNTEFINASWNIGKLFRSLGYSQKRLIGTDDYLHYKANYIDKIFFSLQFYKMRSKAMINSLPDLSNLPYALIKGESLAISAFGAPGTRISCDIDLLIPKFNESSMKALFYEAGFFPTTQDRICQVAMETLSHQSVPVYKRLGPYGNCCVDFNHDLLWGEYEGKRIDIDEFLSDSIEIELFGHRIKVLTPLKAFIQLALHQYKDMNSLFLLSTRKNRWKEKLSELYCMFSRNINDIPKHALCEKCSFYEISEYIYFVFYCIYQMYPDSTILDYMESVKCEKGISIVNSYGLNSQERKQWKCDFLTRLNSEKHYPLIESDLMENDKKKIEINRNLFIIE